jgi:uncharacterized membrane protein
VTPLEVLAVVVLALLVGVLGLAVENRRYRYRALFSASFTVLITQAALHIDHGFEFIVVFGVTVILVAIAGKIRVRVLRRRQGPADDATTAAVDTHPQWWWWGPQ